MLKSPVPSLLESWHVRVAFPVIWNPLLHEAVHVPSNAVLAAQSVLPSDIFGGVSHVIAEKNISYLDNI